MSLLHRCFISSLLHRCRSKRPGWCQKRLDNTWWEHGSQGIAAALMELPVSVVATHTKTAKLGETWKLLSAHRRQNIIHNGQSTEAVYSGNRILGAGELRCDAIVKIENKNWIKPVVASWGHCGVITCTFTKEPFAKTPPGSKRRSSGFFMASSCDVLRLPLVVGGPELCIGR